MQLGEYQPGGPLPAFTVKDFALWRTPFELEHALRLRFLLAASQGFFLDALRPMSTCRRCISQARMM